MPTEQKAQRGDSNKLSHCEKYQSYRLYNTDGIRRSVNEDGTKSYPNPFDVTTKKKEMKMHGHSKSTTLLCIPDYVNITHSQQTPFLKMPSTPQCVYSTMPYNWGN